MTRLRTVSKRLHDRRCRDGHRVAASAEPWSRSSPTSTLALRQLVGAVSDERLAAILKKLESFGTRNTLSSTDSPTRGIGAARQWILDEMKGYSPKLQVGFDTYRIARQGRITRDVEVRNVMAVLPGRSARRVYVSGHYDTVAIEGGQSSSNAAPTDAGQDRATLRSRGAQRPSCPRGERRRQRHRADDGAGPHFRSERHRLRRHAGVHVSCRRGAGTVWRASARAESGRRSHPDRRGLQQRHRRQRQGR